MLNKVSNKIAEILIKQKIVDKDDIEIYQFGIYQAISFFVNILSTIAILAVYDMFFEGLLFCLFYFLLRCYGGGYHAKSPVYCYILSVLLIIVEMNLINYFNQNTFVNFLIIPSCLIVWILSPIETDNKKLDNLERKVYQGRTRVILLVSILSVILLYVLNISIVSLFMAIITEAFMQILGIMDNKLREKIYETV